MANSDIFPHQILQMLEVGWSLPVPAHTGWLGVVLSPALPLDSGQQGHPHVKASRSREHTNHIMLPAVLLTNVKAYKQGWRWARACLDTGPQTLWFMKFTSQLSTYVLRN